MNNRAISVTLVILGFFVAWELLVRALGLPAHLLPPPSAVLLEIASEPKWYAMHTLYTLYTTMLGFGFALLLGVAAAIGIVYSRWLESTLYTLLVSLNSIP
mgnify:CR=1 FL=1